jgi:uncharacterized small protein (DUF1192 family)
VLFSIWLNEGTSPTSAGSAGASFGAVLMDDAQIDERIASLEATIEWLRAQKGAPARPAAVSAVRRRKVDATDAFHRYGFAWSDAKIQRVCRNHDGTWARKIGGWVVIEPDFGVFVAAVESGEASFKF